jgi:hypothetical protein
VHALTLVPTLRVGMPSSTLRVVRARGPSGRGHRASRTASPRGAWGRGSPVRRRRSARRLPFFLSILRQNAR